MAESNLVAALAKVQGNLPSVKKEGKGNFGKYVTLDTIHAAILPVLAENSLAWSTMPGYDENGEGVLFYKLMHTSGETIEGSMRLLTGQQTPQGQGSAITYARRYAITSVLGITADEDDDGAAGSSKPAPEYNKVIKTVADAQEVLGGVEEISLQLQNQFLKLRRDKGMTTAAGTIDFIRETIKKDKPVTSKDYEELILALEAKENV